LFSNAKYRVLLALVIISIACISLSKLLLGTINLQLQTKNQIIASSSGWVAALLNFLPGLGTGYLYQRRWIPYWITTITSAAWVYLDLSRQYSIDASDPASLQTDNTGLIGILLISSVSAYEAAIKVKKERELALTNQNED